MSEKIRIAFVANRAWNLLHYRRPVINACLSAGYDVFLLAPDDGFLPDLATEFPSAHVRPLRRLTARRLAPFHDFLFFGEMSRFFRHEKPALALFFTAKPNVWGNLAARFFPVKTISTLTGLGFAFTNRKGWSVVVGGLYKLALKTSGHTVFHNEDDLHFFENQGWISSEKASIVAGSGIQMNDFRPIFRTDEEAENKPFRFLFVGRFLKDKGLPELAEAAQLIQNQSVGGRKIEIELVGDIGFDNPNSVSETWLDEQVAAGSFILSEWTESVQELLAKADCLVHPSHREGLPRAILEAMAMGKPIVTTDVPGCRRAVIDGENGFLAKPGDAKSLAEMMLKMANLPAEKRLEMGKKGWLKASLEFDARHVVADYLRMIEKLLAESSSK